ncbi:hypothetical protein Tco_1491893 [Tanacetum coccineum]
MGVNVQNPNVREVYSTHTVDKQNTNTMKVSKENEVKLKNAFEALNDDVIETNDLGQHSIGIINESDSEDVDEEIVMGEQQVNDVSTNTKGASTPIDTVLNVYWDWTSNSISCSKGSRILLGWNRNDVDLLVIHVDDQVIHTRIWLKVEKKDFFCSFVYAHNRYTHRRSLWRNLVMHKSFIRQRPWCLLGDFNAALFLDDLAAGSSAIDIAMREFKQCVDEIEVSDVQQSGLKFTWNQKPKGNEGVLKKLDRVLANIEFNDMCQGAHAIFQPYRMSDHAPAVLKIPWTIMKKPRQFKFSNILVSNARFKEVVSECWNTHVSGFHMYKVVQKLRRLKKSFRKLLFETGHIHENVMKLRHELDVVQRDLDLDPFNDISHAVKSRVSRNRIDVVTNNEGLLFENDKVPDAFVSHYEVFLGQLEIAAPDGLLEPRFSFKEAWDIVGNDVILAVREFFINGKLLKELNHTIIALIPMVAAPTRVNDFRPISCCNVLFKCISKIIANRIKSSLKGLISPNQSAFVPGRRFGFHDRMIGWIMECVTTTSFSICINGSLHGYFKGKRGLRQGDPLSPYLFTLVMEILTLIIRRRVRESDLFTYHRYCSKIGVVNLCFADDLFLFAYGDTSSASVIMAALDEFTVVCGHNTSLPKSTAYFCGVTNHVKHAILQILPFEDGRLPVKYLGVPLVSSRLIFRDCKELLEKVQIRVDDWKNKFSLSIAVKAFISHGKFVFLAPSQTSFWASIFMHPTRILLITADQAGLGIRKLDAFNKALMTTQVWKLLSRKESLWVEWIHVYKLRGRSFWDIPYRGNMTWVWRNVLKLRPLIREFIWKKIGNGSTTSVWFDRWCIQSPLADLISSRDIFSEGFNKETKTRGSSLACHSIRRVKDSRLLRRWDNETICHGRETGLSMTKTLIPIMKHLISLTNPHEEALTRALIVKRGTHPSMIRVPVTIKILVMANFHFILRVSHSSSTVVRPVEVPIIARIVKPGTSLSMSLILDLDFDSQFMRSHKDTNSILEEMLRPLKPIPRVGIGEPEGSNDYTEMPFDDEQILRQHNIAHVTPLAYTLSLPFLTTMEPATTLLMGDEVISTTPARENDELIKSSVDDLVLISRESEVTSNSNLECDMPIYTPLPTTDVREENFDINSPLGKYVVDFLMENEDVAGLLRHLVKRLISHLIKNPSLTKRMSNEPLGEDSKPRSYDVTSSNPLFDFNDDYTLCYDNPLFDEEFEGISSLDPPESTPVINESSLLVTPLPDPEQICLREVERFDHFFSLTQSGGTTRVMETLSFGFHHMPSPTPVAYSHMEVMYCYYHPHLTSGDGFDHGSKMK